MTQPPPNPNPGRRRSMPSQRRTPSTSAQLNQLLQHQQDMVDQITQTMGALQNVANVLDAGLYQGLLGAGAGNPYIRSNTQANRRRATMGDHAIRPDVGLGVNPNYGRGLGGLRRTLARGLEGRFGTSAGSTYQRTFDRHGNHAGWIERQSDGTIIQHDSPDAISESDIAAAGRRATTSGILGAVGEGGAIAGLRAVPYVGAAVLGAEAIHEGATFITDQRAANAQYQSIYGGSNLSGLGQRADQFGFQLGQLFGGGMTWGQSQQAFQGVSALGLQGPQRSSDLTFISENYNRMGVSVSDSLKLVTTATQDLNESLTGLQEGLTKTRQAAIASGQSGNTGTQIMTQNYGALAQNYADTTGGVAGVASTISRIQAGLGRYMSGVSIAPMLNDPNQIAIMASHLGMTPTQVIGAIQNNDRSVYRGIDWNLSRTLAPTLSNPDIRNFIQSRITSAGGPDKLTPDQIQIFTSELMKRRDFNVNALMNQLQSAGITGESPQQAASLLFSNLGGKLNFEQAGREQRVVRPDQSAGVGYVSSGGRGGGAESFDFTRTGVNPVIDDALRRLGRYSVEVDTGSGKRIVDIKTAARYYPDQVAKGTAIVMGTGGKTVSQMLGNERQNKVLTSFSGSGTQIYGSNLHHITPQTNYNSTKVDPGKAGTSKDDLSSRQGMSVSAYNKMVATQASKTKADSASAKTSGTVLIKPSPELQRLLQFTPSGNVAIANSSAAQGLTPQPGFIPGTN